MYLDLQPTSWAWEVTQYGIFERRRLHRRFDRNKCGIAFIRAVYEGNDICTVGALTRLQGDFITVESLLSKMGDVFWQHLLVRAAYLLGERRPLLGPDKAQLLRTYPSKLPFILYVGNPCKQVVSENVSHSLCV